MAQSKYYNTGGGILYFTPIVNGALTTEEDFGGTENVAFSSEIETIEHDNTEGSVIITDLSILKKITGTIAIETCEISPAMLTRAFLGTKYVTSVVANAIGATPALGFITATSLDTPYAIGVRYLDEATIVVKDDTDVTTYVLGTDYTLSTVNNVTSITALSSGSILALDVLHISADNVGYEDLKIEAFMQSKIEGQLRFVSDPANGTPYTYTFHKVSLLASGDFGLKSPEELAKLSFEGTMLASELITDPNESKLFTIQATELVQ